MSNRYKILKANKENGVCRVLFTAPTSFVMSFLYKNDKKLKRFSDRHKIYNRENQPYWKSRLDSYYDMILFFGLETDLTTKEYLKLFNLEGEPILK